MSAPASTTSDESGTLRCARHPNTETLLRCGRCDTPICARCMIMSPVGARCPTCAQVKRFALLLKPVELARAIGYGVGVGALGTIVLAFIPFLGLLGLAAVGFGVGEAVSVGANRKRVPVLPFIAVACFLIGFDLGPVILDLIAGRPLSGAMFLGGLGALRNSLALVGLGLGALLAWMRVR